MQLMNDIRVRLTASRRVWLFIAGRADGGHGARPDRGLCGHHAVLSIIRANNQTIQATRLTQELRATLAVVAE